LIVCSIAGSHGRAEEEEEEEAIAGPEQARRVCSAGFDRLGRQRPPSTSTMRNVLT
jgi:hypothetical protein